MGWVDLRQKMSKEEIVEVANKSSIKSIPVDHVVFDEKRMVRLIRRMDPSERPPKKKKENMHDGVMRDFLDEKERQKYIDEFGPYGMSLINDFERDYFRKRKEQILTSEDFEIDPELDMTIVMMVIMDEVIQQRFLEQMSVTPTNQSLNKQITEIQRRYRENLKILDATREQRNSSGDNDKVDSLAAAVLLLQENKKQRLEEMKRYKAEEEELLRKVAMKAPPELDYFDVEESEITYSEDGYDD